MNYSNSGNYENYPVNKKAVQRLVPVGEILSQLAEECVELSGALLEYDEMEASKGAYCNVNSSVEDALTKKWDAVREEIADVQLTAEVLFGVVYEEEEQQMLQSMVKSVSIVANDLTTKDARKALHRECLALAKAALKLRRAMGWENPTPITEGEAKKTLFCHISAVVALCGRLSDTEDIEQMLKIITEKMERWAERLRGGMEDGNGIQ